MTQVEDSREVLDKINQAFDEYKEANQPK